ncbi:hypothetical protein CHS0354_000795 [Potamilus streckersoni]|uniref:Amino acid permease n=1 Tax=Potamilus streckersoni TaxID=2493646 RepID=A0AAE0T7K7_9BIVA|nr:hypothetical protein CHS0354_000795 [Potamilus streckersoni]
MLGWVSAIPSGIRAIPSGIKAIPSGIKAIPSGIKAIPSGIKAIPSGIKAIPSGIKAIPSGIKAIPSGIKAIPSGIKAIPSGKDFTLYIIFLFNILMEKNMVKRHVNIRFRNVKQAELAPLALKIVGDMTANVAVFPKPEPSLAVITDDANVFAVILAKPEYPGRTGDLKNARLDLEAKLKVLGQYVNNVAKGDEAILEKSGFPLSKVPSPHGDIPATTEAGVELDADGHFDIWATPPEADYYGVIFAATVADNPDDDPSHWVFQYCATPEVTFTNGIVSGKKYKFAVAFVGSKSLMKETHDSENGLKRSLTSWSLISLGIGAIIGAGLFVRTAAAAANHAGPAVVLGFVVAGIGCVLAGLCYAEFASMIPIAGSAYTYSYATMGEFIAWIIGWDLVLEYAVAAATVSIAWSEYLNKLLFFFNLQVPYEWSHSPFEMVKDASGQVMSQGIMNVPAVFIVFILTVLLVKGVKESTFVNNIIVILKVAIVLMVIVFGWSFINPVNHTPFIPEPSIYVDTFGVSHNFGGIMGILGAAGVVFFAFIGFDAVSTAAQEAKNPKRDMPIGILASLAICTVLYILFSYVLTGIASTEDFRSTGKEASVAFAIHTYMTGYDWLAKSITVAILAGFSSVILVMLMGQSRVFFAMSRDGLVPKVFSDIHPVYRTPYKSNWIFFVFVGLFAGFVPGEIAGDMTSIGTLFAFMIVSAGVWIMRVKNPDLTRQFKTPWVPLVPILAILVCGAMIYGLGWTNWLRLAAWLGVGLIIYFAYGIRKSKLNQQ